MWIDDQINYGEDWWAIIVNAIKTCRAFIVIMTPDADKSRWVQREVTIADQLHKKMFPLLLEGEIVTSEHWLMFVRTQYVDVRNGQLPGNDFYNDLAEYAQRHAFPGTEIAAPSHIKLRITPSILVAPFEWCEIPAGNMKLIDSFQRIDTFLIAKFPVTNAQYQAFVHASDGYRNLAWWNYSYQAREWRIRHEYPLDSCFIGDIRPREMVTWYEAMAFCNWLSDKLGLKVMLPSLLQRQRAFQGEDERLYPWGNEFDARRCNTRENFIQKTTPVDKYSTGVSPFGVMDLSGNVWEWCLSDDGTEAEIYETHFPPVCGGGWRSRRRHTRSYWTRYHPPDYSASDVGFRVCALNPS